MVGQCECEGHKFLVRADAITIDAKTIRRLDRLVVDSTVHHLCEYHYMENQVPNDSLLGSERGRSSNSFESTAHHE